MSTTSEKQLRTFVAYTEDRPGVLNRVTSLFRRRAYNIQSLTVVRTHTPGISRLTLVIEADDDAARAIAQLLGPSPVAIDELVRQSGASTASVQLALLELELAGRVDRHAGGKVSLNG